jgi:hypothetical protein
MKPAILLILFLISCTNVDYVDDPYSYYFQNGSKRIHFDISQTGLASASITEPGNREFLPITDVTKLSFQGATEPIIKGEFVKRGETQRCQNEQSRCQFYEIEIYDLKLNYSVDATSAIYRFNSAPVCGGVLSRSVFGDLGPCF